MLKKLDLLVVRSYVGPLLATFFISVFLLLMQFLWKYIDDMVGKGLEWSVIAELLLYASAGLVPMALPLAILLASIMVFGNLAEYNELMAMKSAGIPLQRIMLPVLAFNIMVAAGAYFFSNNVLPYTNLKMGALLYDVRQQRPELNIREGVFYKGIDGISIKIAGKDNNTAMMRGLMIYDHRKRDGNLSVTVADSGTMIMSPSKQYLVLTLYSGARYEEVRNQGKIHEDIIRLPSKREIFGQERIVFELEGLDFKRSSTELFKDNFQMLNSAQLRRATDSLEKALYSRQREFFEGRLYGSSLMIHQSSDTAASPWVNIDSIFSALTELELESVYREALSSARSGKHALMSNSIDYQSRLRWINRHNIELQRKYTIAVACVLLFFIGAPFGAIVRKGGLGMPVVISVVFFIIYYVITMTGEKYVKAGEVGYMQGMWFASIVLLPLGLVLTYQATNDRVVASPKLLFTPIKKLIAKLLGKNKPANSQ
jgi:lipopolysaccharide export system permease protein